MGNEELFKEIDLIQGCIKRMASNSFLVKGWALSAFAGVTAITKGENLNDIALLICTTLVPFVCFWILDKAVETNDFYIIANDMIQEFMSYCVCCNQWGLGSLVIGSSPTEYLR